MASFDLFQFSIILLIYIPLSILTWLIVVRAMSRNYKNRLNQLFTLLVLSYNLGFIFWFSYDFVSEESQVPLALILDNLAFTLWAFGTGVLFLYLLILKDVKILNSLLKQVSFLAGYLLLVAIPFFFPQQVDIKIHPDGRIERPAWELPLAVYYLAWFLLVMLLSTLIGLKVMKAFEGPELKKKLMYLILAQDLYCLVLFNTAFMRWIDIQLVRNIISALDAILLVSAFLAYLAIGQPIRDDL